MMKRILLLLHSRKNRRKIRQQLPLSNQINNKVSKPPLSLLFQRKLHPSLLVLQRWSILEVMPLIPRLNRYTSTLSV
jgi:hypothetical protein